MPATDFQLGFKKETTVGTPVVVTAFQEANSDGIEFDWRNIDNPALRSGQRGQRDDRFTPYFGAASGSIEMDVLTKNFAFFLEHMLGTVATTGPTDTVVYTHTGTIGDLFTKAFTCQVNRPFYTTGNQAFTLAGTKIKSWELSNSVEQNLMLKLEVDGMSLSDATALATASYPTTMENFSFAGGAVTIGGSSVDVTDVTIGLDNKLRTDARRYYGNVRKEQVVEDFRIPTFSLKCDWENMTQYNRVKSATRAGALAAIVATWTAPTLLTGAASTFGTVTVTIPSARFDKSSFPVSGPDPLDQELEGKCMEPAAGGSSISIAVKTVETTP